MKPIKILLVVLFSASSLLLTYMIFTNWSEIRTVKKEEAVRNTDFSRKRINEYDEKIDLILNRIEEETSLYAADSESGLLAFVEYVLDQANAHGVHIASYSIIEFNNDPALEISSTSTAENFLRWIRTIENYPVIVSIPKLELSRSDRVLTNKMTLLPAVHKEASSVENLPAAVTADLRDELNINRFFGFASRRNAPLPVTLDLAQPPLEELQKGSFIVVGSYRSADGKMVFVVKDNRTGQIENLLQGVSAGGWLLERIDEGSIVLSTQDGQFKVESIF